MIRRLAFVVPTCVALICACSDSAPPTERVVVAATFGPGSHSSAECPIAYNNWLDIGSFGVPPSFDITPINNNDNNTDGSGPVSIVCAVRGNDAAGYDVDVSATLSGLNGGSIAVTGHMTPTGTQASISGVLQRSDYGAFRESDCTVTFTDNPNMGVAPGRVWGTLHCPNIVRMDQNRTCAADAPFRFENCDQ